MLAPILRNEWRLLRADRTLHLVAALLAILVAYGVYNGSAWVRFQSNALDSAAGEEAGRLAAMKTAIADVEAGRSNPPAFADPRSPSAAGRSLGTRWASMPPTPLAALAIGQSDLYPYYFRVSTQSRLSFAQNDEIEHPVHLLSGRFDLAFVVLFLYPLVILGLSYNMISAEKESGTLAVTLSQPIALRTLAFGKILTRFLLVALLGVALPAAGVLLSGADLSAEGAGMRLLLWIAVVVAYGAFWFAVAALVNAAGASSPANAIALAGLWLLFVVLTPAIVNGGAKLLHPVPSRVEMIQAMRDAGRQAAAQRSELLAAYLEDHPEFTVSRDGAMADFATIGIVTAQATERAMQPVLERFEKQLDAQQALVDRYRFLSPAILAQAALNDIAGTGVHRYRHFQQLADAFHERWRQYFIPRVMKREVLAPPDVDQFPAWTFEEESLAAVLSRTAASLAGLIVLSVLCFAGAAVALNRYRVAG
ncbi:MAG: DUF3526 domain-containing protein [Bryobacterales bacterium]|nr:DUF3526 domain-containing protein [Bryobacterales bacterium]